MALLMFYGKFKQGVAIDPDMDRVFGVQADGWGEVACLIKDITGNWIAPDNFAPPSNYVMPPSGLGAACFVAYSDWYEALFMVGYKDDINDYISILDANTGAILFQFQAGC